MGGSTRGYRDGEDPQFDGPEGVAFSADARTLFVADSRTHTVRAVDLGNGFVRTVAGVGHQLRTTADLRAGALSSPWDLAVVGDRIFIAMAGSHQIYSVAATGEDLVVHAGNRHEDIRDTSNLDAALAQPMGIVAAGERLYFTDSETSAVRWSDQDPHGRVETVIGTGLFDFGDRDGTGDEVLMQHQQGLASDSDGRLLVADSYNDALKWVDPGTRVATTWIRDLHEPSGVALISHRVYVADTNAHRIAVVDRESQRTSDLDIQMPTPA